MSNVFLIGYAGSGKSIYIKNRISNNLKEGKPSLYINFMKASDDFSKRTINESLIVNSNSFTQISKIKDKEYNDLVIIDFSEQNNSLSIKIKEKVILEILRNENWKNHEIFIDEAYYLTNYEQISQNNRKSKIFYSLMQEKDLKISRYDDIVYFAPSIVSNTPKDISDYLNNKIENILKYVEDFNNIHNYTFIDFREYNSFDSSLSHNEKIELLVGM